LQSPWKWPEVWSYNPQIENPHLIYPGDVVYLEYDAQGRPILRVSRGQATVKMSPQVHATRVDTPIASIPLNAIEQFLGEPRVLSQREIDNAGYVLSGKDARLMSGSGDRIYARGLIPGEDPNSTYAVLRIGKPYRNPGAKPETSSATKPCMSPMPKWKILVTPLLCASKTPPAKLWWGIV